MPNYLRVYKIANCSKKETMPYKPNYVNPKLNFTNLLKEEQSFLEKLSNLENFRFEEDLKINGKRVRCAKVLSNI